MPRRYWAECGARAPIEARRRSENEIRKKSPRYDLDAHTAFAYTIRIFQGDPPRTIARRELVDVSVTRWYHCISRCVRRAFLLGEGLLDRKQWVEDRILLVDHTVRLFREGRARISAKLAGILDRIGSSAEEWQLRMEKLKNGRSFGRFFAASRDKLRELAMRMNVRHLVNLVGCAAP
jgi:hypothetical protein